jgi:CBS domain-containing protein
VGPLTSAVIGGLCLGIAYLAGGDAHTPGMAMLSWLGYINLALAGFNMIPGYPLDGGRVLRAAVWWKTGDVDRSTRIAALTGQAVAVLFIAVGILQYFAGKGIGGLWIAFIGWFLLQASRESYVRVNLTHALEGVRVGDVMTRDCPTVDGWLNLQNFVEQELLRTGRRCFMVVEKGEVAGLVTPREVTDVERAKWPFTTLHDVMRPVDEMDGVTPETPLSSALDSMGAKNIDPLPVISGGHLRGVLSKADVLAFLQTKAELRG